MKEFASKLRFFLFFSFGYIFVKLSCPLEIFWPFIVYYMIFPYRQILYIINMILAVDIL